METLLDKIESLCRENCVTMDIWCEGRYLSMAELKFLLNTGVEFLLCLYLPARIGSEWDDGGIITINNLWIIGPPVSINPRFHADFEHEFFQRLLYKTFQQ